MRKATGKKPEDQLKPLERTDQPRPEQENVLGGRNIPSIGIGTPRGIGVMPRLPPEAAAAFATYVDSARTRAANEGKTLVYTIRWGQPAAEDK